MIAIGDLAYFRSLSSKSLKRDFLEGRFLDQLGSTRKSSSWASALIDFDLLLGRDFQLVLDWS